MLNEGFWQSDPQPHLPKSYNDYEITFIVFHETEDYKGEDNYWIQWKIEDKSGKSSTKLQGIKFEEVPDETEVRPFTECKRRNGDSC